jgi:hypothetical protein
MLWTPHTTLSSRAALRLAVNARIGMLGRYLDTIRVLTRRQSDVRTRET